MRNVIIAFSAAALLASAGPALAKSKKHNGHHGGHHKSHHVHKHHNHHGHKHHRKHRRQGWGSSFFFAFPVVQHTYRPNPVYVEPMPRQRARFNCQNPAACQPTPPYIFLGRPSVTLCLSEHKSCSHKSTVVQIHLISSARGEVNSASENWSRRSPSGT